MYRKGVCHWLDRPCDSLKLTNGSSWISTKRTSTSSLYQLQISLSKISNTQDQLLEWFLWILWIAVPLLNETKHLNNYNSRLPWLPPGYQYVVSMATTWLTPIFSLPHGCHGYQHVLLLGTAGIRTLSKHNQGYLQRFHFYDKYKSQKTFAHFRLNYRSLNVKCVKHLNYRTT